MHVFLLLAAALVAACAPSSPGRATSGAPPPAARDTVRADWDAAIRAERVAGAFVVYEPATGRTSRSSPAEAARRHLPASTFKVYNALVALGAGVVADPDSVFVWDGVERSIEAWNRDHTLRSGMASSVVWLYQRVARDVGRDRYRAAFAREPYGNGQIGPDVDAFWLDGTLQISADEQVRFMDRLRRNELAFPSAVQATVRDLLPVLVESDGARLVGKTGWGGGETTDGPPETGWLVGWVTRADGGTAVFALALVVAPGTEGVEMGPLRLRLVRHLLAADGWF